MEFESTLKWFVESDLNGCITVTSKYKRFNIIISIFYKYVLSPYSITKIYNYKGECNYQQKREIWSRSEAILEAEKFITSIINDPDVISISEYLENSHLNYTWVSKIDDESINLVFGEKIKNERFCTLIGKDISMNSVATNVFKLRLFDRHGIRKYTI